MVVFVEDNHGVAECTTPHKCQRSYLYDIRLHILFEFGRGYHILQGIIKRLQIGVYLLLHVTGQETELLAGLHRRTAQDNALGLLVFERAHGQGNGHIGLSRTGRTQRKNEVVVADGLHQFLLVGRTGRNGLPADTVYNHVIIGRIGYMRHIVLDNLYDNLFVQRIMLLAIGDKLAYLLFERCGFQLVAYNFQHIPPRHHAELGEKILYQLHVAVVDTIKQYGVYVVENDYALYHLRLYSLQNGVIHYSCKDSERRVQKKTNLLVFYAEPQPILSKDSE